MDIDPKSIYAAFGSKEGLYLPALERYPQQPTTPRIWGLHAAGQTASGACLRSSGKSGQISKQR